MRTHLVRKGRPRRSRPELDGPRLREAGGAPFEPWRNGYVESYNSRIRDECLNINIFWSLSQARVAITDWMEDYSQRRLHSALGYQAPSGLRGSLHPPTKID